MVKFTRLAGAALVSALALGTLGATAQVAHADPYGTAGCGLGSIVFKDKPGFIQVVAATLNGTGFQTFAISSGTSNCGSSAPNQVAAAAFIETNREAFAKDAARGQGETISNLSTLAGCTNPAAVGTVLQSDFNSIFPSATASDVEISSKALQALKSHSELACSQLI
ncbi:MAG: hypothetical protein JWN48_2090 [Myxococcaceae bacterium]|nr:hypothetical protein [Myxococcaceae bacterium]